MAPADEIAFGLPQDSICITVATRFGSKRNSAAHCRISFSQCKTSGVNRCVRVALVGELSLGSEMKLNRVRLKNSSAPNRITENGGNNKMERQLPWAASPSSTERRISLCTGV